MADEIERTLTYAFVGSAGTGKSQRAQHAASILGADYIIDDGLLIHKGHIICGKSAKSERNQVSAIRRALFQYSDHRKEIMDYLKTHAPLKVMVIATSDDMAIRILKKIGLPAPERILHIEDIASPEEIKKAFVERHIKHRHVIPVSQVLVRQNFAGKLVGQLRVLWKSHEKYEGEKTIVRPPFSFYGEIHIAPEAIIQLASYIALRTEQVAEIKDLKVDFESEDDPLDIEIKIVVKLGGKKFFDIAGLVKEHVSRSLSYFTGHDVKTVNVIITGIKDDRKK